MNRSFLFFLLILFSFSALAQKNVQNNNCGEKDAMEKLFRQFPEIKKKQQEIDRQWSQYVQQKQSFQRRPAAPATYTLPVVVHIISNNGPENISDAQVLTGIQHLNEAYSNIGYYDPANGVDTKIQFCMAERDTVGVVTNGITRNTSAYTLMSGGPGGTDYTYDDQHIKNLNRWNPQCYINIWLVNSIPGNVVGYAYLPSAAGSYLDGIIIEAAYFGSSYSNDVVVAHEMGHYLGLYHTFEGGCTNNDCSTDGDLVCDTPPDNSTAWIGCGNTQNSCTTDALSGFSTDQNDLLSDYMDYGNWDCMKVFTQGQSDRMNWTVANIRSSLLHCRSCLPPCPSPVKAAFTSPGAIVNAASSYTFTNNSLNAASYIWYVNGIQQATSSNYTLNFNDIGFYTIKLIAKSGNSTLCADDSVTVTVQAICPVKASFVSSATSVGAGSTVNFINQSTGADSYQWYINGVLQSTAANYSYTTNVGGQYIIELVATNNAATCTAQYIDTVIFTCPVTAAFTPVSANVLLNDTVHFINASSNAVSYQWYIDGVVTGTATDFSTHFSVGGDYVIQLQASNGICISTQLANVFVMDTCLQNTWEKMYTAGTYDGPSDGCKTPDGGVLITGSTNSFNVAKNFDGYLMKLDKLGNIMWSKTYSDNTKNLFSYIQPSMDGNYYVISNTTEKLLKVDPLGNLLWTKQIVVPDYSDNELHGLITTSDNGCVITGMHSVHGTQPAVDVMVVKTDANGNVVWSKAFENPQFTCRGSNAYEDTDGYIITGDYVRATNSSFIMKLDKLTGNMIWITSFDFDGRGSSLENIIRLKDNYIIAGRNFDNNTYTNWQGLVAKADLKGNVTHASIVTSTMIQDGPIALSNDGGYITAATLNGNSSLAFVKYDANNNVEWGKEYLHGGITASRQIFQNDDNTYTAVAAVDTGYGATMVAQILRIDGSGNNTGCIQPSTIDPVVKSVSIAPQQFSWKTIYSLQYQSVVSSLKTTDVQYRRLYSCGGKACTPIIPDTCSGKLCDTLLLQAPDTVCNFSNTIVCSAKRGVGCTLPVKWLADTSFVTITATTDSTISLLFKKAGIATITGTLNNGCKTFTDSLHIAGFKTPAEINLGPDINLCNSSVVNLHAGAGFVSYVWQNNTTDSTLTAYLPGTYYVTATDYCGSSYSDTIIIKLAADVSFNLGNDTSICIGDTIALMAPGGFTNYLWSPAYKISPASGQTVKIFTDTDTLYVVTAQKYLGCTVVDSIRIYSKVPSIIHLGNDTSFCAGKPLLLNAGPGYFNYIWSTGETGQTINVSVKGSYSVKAVDNNNCTVKDTIVVKNVFAPPVVYLGKDTSICANINLVLDAGAGYKKYLWQDASASQTYTANTTGTYYVQVTDMNNCIGTDTIVVNAVNQAASVYLGKDTVICSSDKLILDAGAGFVSYSWQDGTIEQTEKVTNTGNYYVAVTNSSGCKGADSILITVSNIPFVNLGKDTSICIGTSLLLDAGGHATYLWEDGSKTEIHKATNVGGYTVRVTDNNNFCTATGQINILSINDSSKGFLAPSLQICLGENNIIRSMENYVKYLWSTGSTSNAVTVADMGVYQLTVTNNNNCVSTETIVVSGNDICRSIIFPGAFTPNGDNKNDYFIPKVYGAIAKYKMAIFNRWGRKVFESNDYKKGWDGTFQGQPQNTGAYVWMAEYQFDNLPLKIEKGTIILIRE